MKRMRSRMVLVSLIGVATLVLVGCGDSKKNADTTAVADTGAGGVETTVGAAPADTTSVDSTVAGADAAANACPVEGCKVEINVIGKSGAGPELVLDFTPNYTPSMSKNHIHVYWDRWKAEQVSNDAEPRFKATQGEWVPTDVVKGYVTEGATSTDTKARGESHTLCVTAGDRNHNVIDPTLVNCVDVSSLL